MNAGGARSLGWADIPAETVLPGVTRWVLHGERQTLVRYRYEPGAIFPRHAHPEEQITVVLAGEIEFDADGAPVRLQTGQIALLPGDVPHGAQVIGDEPVETLNTLAPRRAQAPAFPTGVG